ncbi:hypothetical protein CROQUDRAFT_91162, partial [Cronartium quercuum f. sp. fusiforme G11]
HFNSESKIDFFFNSIQNQTIPVQVWFDDLELELIVDLAQALEEAGSGIANISSPVSTPALEALSTNSSETARSRFMPATDGDAYDSAVYDDYTYDNQSVHESDFSEIPASESSYIVGETNTNEPSSRARQWQPSRSGSTASSGGHRSNDTSKRDTSPRHVSLKFVDNASRAGVLTGEDMFAIPEPASSRA